MNELNQDQNSEKPVYHNPHIAQQHEDGLLSRSEADLLDLLASKDVVLEASSSDNGNDQVVLQEGQSQRVLISQIYIRCLWNDVPTLRQWLTQFLSTRQPEVAIIAAGMAKQGLTKIALTEQQAIEGYLVIGSAERELHGSVAEKVVEHLVAEGQICGYAVYTVPVILY